MFEITPIGYTNHRNKNIPFGIKYMDRGGHIYAIGKTGMGKSTLLQNMALFDISQGRGVGVIDPHGDTVSYILEHIPQERMNDVIFLNVSNKEAMITFNPLLHIQEENRYKVASNVTSVFKKLWSESWGPRLEHILRNTLHALTYYPDATLLDIVPILTDQYYRNQILQYVQNASLQRFWEKEYNTLSPQQKNEHIAPILNKVGILTSHPIISRIIGNHESSISLTDIMDNRKIFLTNLSKGVLGEEGTQFLGSLLVTEFQNAALSRVHIPFAERIPFYLFIDEAHSFMTLSFADILSESRKYGLCLYLTHQYLDQLHEDIRTAILGNIGTLICFRVGTADAEILENEFCPIFTKEDLVALPQFHMYIKLLIDGCVSEGFSGRIISSNK